MRDLGEDKAPSYRLSEQPSSSTGWVSPGARRLPPVALMREHEE
jgi:hypothetical protein